MQSVFTTLLSTYSVWNAKLRLCPECKLRIKKETRNWKSNRRIRQCKSCLNTRNIFWLWSTHVTWVADGTHQIPTCYHTSICPTKQQRLCISVEEKNGVKCVYRRGDILPHIGVCCKQLASQALLKMSKELEISGTPYCQPHFWLVTALRLAGYGQPSLKSKPRAQCFQ